MYFLYNIFVHFIAFILKPIALFNKKIYFFLNGRKETFSKLKSIKKTDKVIWIHCASLGEFEQGRPIIENLKDQYKNHKIVLTFFSPSGYEVRKNYAFADVICYLPLDTKKNVKRFLKAIHPELAIFVKYEFWPNILKELKQKNIKTIVVSAIFRKEQTFFKNHFFAKFMQNALQTITHFFVQNNESKELLNSIGFTNVQVCGDTRFDRVSEITKKDNRLEKIENFINPTSDFTLIAGSTWQKDTEILINYINNHATDSEQFIIAPHAMDAVKLAQFKELITKNVSYYTDDEVSNKSQVLIIDTIGVLNKIYSYGTVAYVGGGFGAGIHNILEPATFGLPIIIGKNYQKFQEAKDLIALKACFSVSNKNEFVKYIQKLKNPSFLSKSSKASKDYILKNIGGTDCILRYIKKIIVTLPLN